ncbi:MAG: 4'-phosphopantetheinyl transferase superfamily protein [Candidatus Saccharibacteria bacterium]
MIDIYVVERAKLKNDSRKDIRHIVEYILSSRLNSTSLIGMSFDEYGKPYIKKSYRTNFNYSHSKNIVAISVVADTEDIGIDTEPLDRSVEISKIAHSAFSERELLKIPNDKFVNAWCLKEASVKMAGKGFIEADPSEFSIEQNQDKFLLLQGLRQIACGYTETCIYREDVITICSSSKIEGINIILYNIADTIY